MPAAGPPKELDSGADPYIVDKRLINDISGVLHKACRRNAKAVVLNGTSAEAELYVADYLQSRLVDFDHFAACLARLR